MTTLILPEGTPTAPPPGARALGVRMAPSLRLSIGFRNPKRNNAPDKLDYFRAKTGANDEFAGAARHFHEVYGETPRAIDVRLPARLEDALRIEYLAFKGKRDDPAGGVMVARGQTNFAALGYCGGPDTLTVWNEDGTVQHVETAGVDALTRDHLDATAARLELMLCTTLRVGLPKVLGYGSFAEITSRSLKSTDQLWAKLRDWYAAFPHGAISFAMTPLLVVAPAHARPSVRMKDGSTKRIRSLVYTLDLRQPDSEEEMLQRLDRYRGSISIQQGAVMPVAEIGPGEGVAPLGDVADMVEDITDAEFEVGETSGGHGDPGDPDTGPPARPHETPTAASAGSSAVGPVDHDALPPSASGAGVSEPALSEQASTPLPAGSAGEDDGGEPVLDPEPAPAAADLSPEDLAAAEAAASVKPPFGSYQTQTLGVIFRNPKNGRGWIEYAIGLSVAGKLAAADKKFERSLWAFAKVYLPDLYADHKEHAK